jgi:hypothetical protein
MSYPKLYIGPMSKNIVDAIIEISNNENIDLGFCASRRQIEYDGGYVNGWSTEAFTKYIKSNAHGVLVCRDHGGPGQGSDEDDGFDSFRHDSLLMDIIHIDPWKNYRDIDISAQKTAECMKLCNNINNKCMFEVGTEQAIREMSYHELRFFLSNLKNLIGADLFEKIVYVVIQSGTSLQEDRNTGEYDEQRLLDMIAVCNDNNVLSKEHNGDYLSNKIIKEKFSLGLDAINIAPEFGVIETMCVLNRVGNNKEVFNNIYQLCYDSGKWKKWVSGDFDPLLNKKQLVKICCHYVFADEKFKEILKLNLFDGLNEEVKLKIKDRIMGIVL